MNRRSFLKSILAAATAPYVVTASGVLMPVRKIVMPEIALGVVPAWLINPPLLVEEGMGLEAVTGLIHRLVPQISDDGFKWRDAEFRREELMPGAIYRVEEGRYFRMKIEVPGVNGKN